MEYGEKRKSVFFTPKNGKIGWAGGFLRLNTVKKEKNQLGGNKNYGKKVLLSLQ